MPAGKLLGPCGVAVVAFVIFNLNGREIPSYDSQPSKYLAIEIASHHTLTLDAVVARTPQFADRPGFVRARDGHYRSAYPLPSAVIAAAVARLLSVVRVLDLDAPLAPAFVAKVTASLLTSLTVGCVFAFARRRLTGWEAISLALGFGIATNMWTLVSQTLWQQETALLLLMVAINLLDAGEGVFSVARLTTLGLLLGLTVWARLQTAPSVAVLAGWVLVRFRIKALPALSALIAVAGVMAVVNVMWFGHPFGALPSMEGLHAQVHGLTGTIARSPVAGAMGLLFSPSRGLLVFSPIVLIALPALLQFRRADATVRWCALAATAQFALYSMYSVWWGGHTYGPRYALDMLPSLVPAATVGIAALRGNRVLTAVATATLLWSIAVAAIGAFVYPAERWNTAPADVDRNHRRLWDWRDSQLIRAAHSGASPQNFALFSKAAIRKVDN